ncbi:hypothetical protein SOVF_164080 [Spinacia oleracea]|uniref:Uncharacterized protein n=1 Tax=Spinacia oleracea TaxID=3562 RepID=A0A9R0J102_SPIOL|nr:uncharacterized protein LOC110798381 [Spinacia oleracea]KNA08253.1 hypothetical protein SOVF_164080 [Spinacia oleracea]
METPSSDADSNSTVDASRPFHSVKEAVAIFGKRVQSPSAFGKVKLSSSSEFTPNSENPLGIAIEIGTPDSYEFTQSPCIPPSISSKQVVDSPVYEPTPSPEISKNDSSSSFPSTSSKEIEPIPSPENPKNTKHGKIVHGNDLVMMLMILKRLESELQETKMEVKLLKERESETEVAVASLNAEFHKNMSKISKPEAAEAGKATASSAASVEEGNQDTGTRDEEGRKFEVMVKNVDSPTLAQILNISDYDCYFGDRKKLKKKMKPVIPLVTDIFAWRKRSTPTKTLSTRLYSWK